MKETIKIWKTFITNLSKFAFEIILVTASDFFKLKFFRHDRHSDK